MTDLRERIASLTLAEAEALHARVRAERARRYARRARASLLDFCRWVIPGFIASRFHRHLCGVLERASATVADGGVARVLLEVPPQHGKTLVLTAWMIWHAVTYGGPMAYGTYSDDRAMVTSRHAQEIAAQVAELWADAARPATKTQTVNDWSTARASFRFVGRGGALTGSPAQILVIDDPYKDAAEGWSPAIRSAVWGWYTSTTQTRLTPAHAVVVLHTRWHEQDLIGQLRDQNERGVGWPWEIVSYPAVAVEHDDLGRAPGDALFPEYRPRAWLDRIRETVGEVVWAALYQQTPTVEEGLRFKRSDFDRRYPHHHRTPPVPYRRRILSVDCNFKAGDDLDRSACSAWGECSDEAATLDVLGVPFNEPMDFPTLVQAVKDAVTEYLPDAIVIEDKANGSALVSTLRKEVAAYCRKLGIKIPAVVEFDPGRNSKDARAALASMHWRAGGCRLPEHAPWLEAWIAQHTGFGAGAAYDDLVDSGSQAVIYLREPEKGPSPLDRAKRRLAALSALS